VEVIQLRNLDPGGISEIFDPGKQPGNRRMQAVIFVAVLALIVNRGGAGATHRLRLFADLDLTGTVGRTRLSEAAEQKKPDQPFRLIRLVKVGKKLLLSCSSSRTDV